MTEEERQRLIEAKTQVSAELAALDIDSYGLSDIDPRLTDYAKSVAGAPEAHNVWEQLALRQFFKRPTNMV